MVVDGVGRVGLTSTVRRLHPEEQVTLEMLEGWRNQQLSRNLQFATIDQRLRYVQRFLNQTNEYPWQWTPGLVDDYFGDLRSMKKLSHSSLRSHQSALRQFSDYVCDPAYGWDRLCIELFGTHPVQVFFEWNTAPHVQENEGRPSKRPFTKKELQLFLDHADEQVSVAASSGKKGWQAAFRDSVMFKVAYSYGLRFNELRHLQTVDFASNPHAKRFGAFGVLKVRYGKAKRASPPKPRTVLTVFDWTPGIIKEWLTSGRDPHAGLDLFPSERGGLIVESTLLRRLRRYCDELALDPELDLHSLRRSYVTHLIEDGWDPLFVKDQVGHEYASTTGIYTFVSNDFRNKTLKNALDQTIRESLESGAERNR